MPQRGVRMVNVETVRLAFLSAGPRHIDVLDWETKTSKFFECAEPEAFRLLKFEPQIKLRAIRMSWNKILQKPGLQRTRFCRKYLWLYIVPLAGTTDQLFVFVGFIMGYGRGLCVTS